MAAPYSLMARSKELSAKGSCSAAGAHQREGQAELALELVGDLQLARRGVERDRLRAAPGEPGRDVARPASKLEDVEAYCVDGKDPEL